MVSGLSANLTPKIAGTFGSFNDWDSAFPIVESEYVDAQFSEFLFDLEYLQVWKLFPLEPRELSEGSTDRPLPSPWATAVEVTLIREVREGFLEISGEVVSPDDPASQDQRGCED
jgi:hypothetical protein